MHPIESTIARRSPRRPDDYLLPQALSSRQAALIVAHPGHELRVHGWLELARPVVFILTDGSGHTGQSRLNCTSRLLASARGRQGSIYGRFTDIDLYAAMLGADFSLFKRLAEELANSLLSDDIDYVVGDAAEGYNPTHDICRAVIDAAVALANKTRNNPVANFDFPVVRRPNSRSIDSGAGGIRLHLDAFAFDRKLAAIRSYQELRQETDRILEEMGTEAFRIESLYPVEPDCKGSVVPERPFYEEYGEKQVREGIYNRVIRYREHILPLTEALVDHSHK